MEFARAILAQSNGGADKVCRNLFGSVDHRKLREDYEKIMSNTMEEARQRWNFDFVTETPLDGSYKWEKVVYPFADVQIIDGGKRKQTLITDYYQVKRRCTPPSSPKASCS